jgi:hypothetical protein
MPKAKRPAAVAAACIVDAPPVRVLVVGVDSELLPETVAWVFCTVEDVVGYGPGTQGFNLCDNRHLGWALTAFGLDFEGLTVDVKLQQRQTRTQRGVGYIREYC